MTGEYSDDADRANYNGCDVMEPDLDDNAAKVAKWAAWQAEEDALEATNAN